jgi:CopG family transcriptional regulator / antitoxin EndoAI
MDTQNVRLNITLPKEMLRLVDQISGPRKRSMFIAEAIRLKVKKTREDELEKRMAEGYQAGYRESLGIASDFEDVDLEGWDDY